MMRFPMRPASDLPPLPESNADEKTLAFLESRSSTNFILPPVTQAGIEAQGWLHCVNNERYAFFERPGFGMRVSQHKGVFQATIVPLRRRWSREHLGDNGRHMPMPEDMLAPEFRGRGAREKARAHAEDVFHDHEGYLRELGVTLTTVEARQYRSSGRGGTMSDRPYRFQWKDGELNWWLPNG